jgi:molybdenum cofactor cytidylyltransferase
MIAGVVLAAGESRRMGRAKAALTVEGETFLERALRTLAAGGCSTLIVVFNPDEPLAPELAFGQSIRAVRGGAAGSEQIESLRAGLRALPDSARAAVVLPVDHPRVRPETVRSLIDVFESEGAAIVRPVCGGRHGHPVLFARAVFEELFDEALPEGARTVVQRHADAAASVEVADRGVLIDVDTPEDYSRHIGGPG